MKLISLPVPVSFRVNTLHHVTADANTSVDLMALQVCFAPVCVCVRGGVHASVFQTVSQTRSRDLISPVGEAKTT